MFVFSLRTFNFVIVILKKHFSQCYKVNMGLTALTWPFQGTSICLKMFLKKRYFNPNGLKCPFRRWHIYTKNCLIVPHVEIKGLLLSKVKQGHSKVIVRSKQAVMSPVQLLRRPGHRLWQVQTQYGSLNLMPLYRLQKTGNLSLYKIPT